MCISIFSHNLTGQRWLRIKHQSGLTLFELIFFMVIVSVGLVGILSVMDLTTRHSADPLLRKQALAIAEAILEEVQLLPVTAAYGCAGMTGIEEDCQADPSDSSAVEYERGATQDGEETVIIPDGYRVDVTVESATLNPSDVHLDGAAKLITITVHYDNDREKMVLQGYRGSYDVLEAF